MSIESDVMTAMKTAMKSRDSDATRALRNLRAAFLTKKKESGADTLSDDDAMDVVRKAAKQLAESIEAYDAGGRDDLAATERAELAVIDQFLPKLADEATTRQWVADAVASTGASGPSDMGKVMGALMKHHKAEIDGKLANRLVREALAS